MNVKIINPEFYNGPIESLTPNASGATSDLKSWFQNTIVIRAESAGRGASP